jgi:hypothetical protein
MLGMDLICVVLMCTPQRIDAHTALVRAWYHNAANFPAQSVFLCVTAAKSRQQGMTEMS